jgi:RNA polymerase sigma-70 factor (ECF subfamily)
MAAEVPDPQARSLSSGSGQGATSLSLLQRLRDNEAEAWRVMVHLYTPLVNHWCGRFGVRGADADDVVQEVFRACAADLPTFRRDRPGDTFRGWLRGITRNKVLLHFRQTGQQPKAFGGTDAIAKLQKIADTAPVPGEEEGMEMSGLYRRALELVRDEFEERTWRAFWLTVLEDRSPVDVAGELGVTPAAIRKAKSRVLHRLKETVGALLE